LPSSAHFKNASNTSTFFFKALSPLFAAFWCFVTALSNIIFVFFK